MSAERENTLVSTEWLAERLGQDNLRIFDCTVFLSVGEDGRYIARAGAEEYEQSHIPGAAFLDLPRDLTEHRDGVPFMMPAPEKFANKAGAAGLGDAHQIVLYSSGSVMWATRMWWMLRSVGFHGAAVLDGGLAQWKAEGRPISHGREYYPQATFTPHPDPDRWADKDDVLNNIGSSNVCTINALSRENYLGTVERSSYGRKGRIKGSASVPYSTLMTAEGLFGNKEQLRAAFASIGALEKERIICYCGGGISATMDAMALQLLGYENVAIYDGSMSEWAQDESLPMETGEPG